MIRTASLIGTRWDAINDSGTVTVIDRPCCRQCSDRNWVLLRDADGQHRHITLATLDADYLPHVGRP